MKYKIGLILLCGLFLTSIIYFKEKKEEYNLLALGDGISIGMTPYNIEGYDFNDYLAEDLKQNNLLNKYYKNFNESDETVSSLLTKINNNETNLENKIKIKQAIEKSKIITIALGMDELNNYASKKELGSSKINSFISKYDELLQQITRYNIPKIYVIGLYKSNLIPKTKIEKINEELKKICQKNSVNFIDINNITENSTYFIQSNSYYLNYKGQKYIYEQINKSLINKTSFLI